MFGVEIMSGSILLNREIIILGYSPIVGCVSMVGRTRFVVGCGLMLSPGLPAIRVGYLGEHDVPPNLPCLLWSSKGKICCKEMVV